MKRVKLAVIIPTHSRATMYRTLCLSLNKTKVPPELIGQTTFCVCADNPTFTVRAPIYKWAKSSVSYSKIPLGCDRNIIKGMDLVLAQGCEWVLNLEDDTLLTPRWLEFLWELKDLFPNAGAYSCYNSRNHSTKSIIPLGKEYQACVKNTIGGFGLLVSRKILCPFLQSLDRKNIHRGWDWLLGEYLQKKVETPFVTTTPSYIQHIGIIGTHTNGISDPDGWDIANDFIGT